MKAALEKLVKLEPDRPRPVQYYHCGQCGVEFRSNAPGTEGESPATYARLNVGMTADGRIVVECARHDAYVIDFKPVLKKKPRK